MAALPAMRHTRGMIKGKITRFERWLTSFDTETGDYGSLRARLDEALPILAQFDQIQSQIEVADQVSDHEAERNLAEASYYWTIGKAKQYLRQHETPPVNANVGAQAGNAVEVIESLTASAENYTIAWELLQKRFDNNKLMISRNLQALVDTQIMQKESGSTLRHMLDHVQKVSRSLKILKANTWDAVFTHHIAIKMDNATKREWKSFTKDIKMPTEANLIAFLEERCSIVDTDVSVKPSNKTTSSHHQKRANHQSFTGVSTDSLKCKVCENSHEVFKCPVFRNLSLSSRTNEVKKHKLCMNCLRSHNGKCTFGRCRQCNKYHNSLLHVDSNQTTHGAKDAGAPTPDPEPSQPVSHHSKTSASGTSDGGNPSQTTAPFTGAVGTANSQVLLSTALVFVEDKYGKTHECRALLVSGSQSNLMTRAFSDRLSLPKERLNVPLGGINNTSTNMRERMQLTMRSCHQAYKSTLPVFIIDEIVPQHPASWIDAEQLKIPKNLTLADPTFNQPGRIDLLIGASILWELLCVGQRKLTFGRPIMQKTQLGWIISGEVPVGRQSRILTSSVKTTSTRHTLTETMEDSSCSYPHVTMSRH